MTLVGLICLYVMVGLGFALQQLLREPRWTWRGLGAAAAALVVWPLWIPFVHAPAERCTKPTGGDRRPACARVDSALACARSRVVATPLDGILTQRDVAGICEQVHRVADRIEALEAELTRLRDGETKGSPRRDSCAERVEHALERDRRALDELGELADALATELTLAQCGHSGSVESLIAELSARLEALTTA